MDKQTAEKLLEDFRHCIKEIYDGKAGVTFADADRIASELDALLGGEAWYKNPDMLRARDEGLKQAKEGNKDALGFVEGWIGLVEADLKR